MLGIEADASFTESAGCTRARTCPRPFQHDVDYVGTVRGRIGYAFGTWLPYVTGGLAWGHTHVNVNDGSGQRISAPDDTRPGWTAGAGVEFAVSGNWSAKLEYDYIDLSRRTYDLSAFGLPAVNVDPSVHLVKLGLNYRFGDTPWMPAPLPAKNRACRNRTTGTSTPRPPFCRRAIPPFRSPYAGPNSLPGGGQVRETWTTTAFLGVRLWQGGEFYFNPELAQGFGLNGTLGLAGFLQRRGAEGRRRSSRNSARSAITSSRPSGSAASRKTSPTPPTSLPGKRDIDRVTLIVGRFAVGDFFDGNAYAHDPRADFMNWAMWSSAAYDFPADLPGYTRGAVVELNRKDWAVRAGAVRGADRAEQRRPHLQDRRHGRRIRGTPRDLRSARQIAGRRIRQQRQHRQLPRGAGDRRRRPRARHQRRHGEHPPRQSQIRLLRSTSSSRSPRTSACSPARAGTTARTRSCRSPTSTAACRAALSIKGSHWGRPTTRSASAAPSTACPARTATSSPPAALGLLIGDGRLNYRPERILETYYAYRDRQELYGRPPTINSSPNPAYNADRGPVSIFSGRLHGEF